MLPRLPTPSSMDNTSSLDCGVGWTSLGYLWVSCEALYTVVAAHAVEVIIMYLTVKTVLT